MPPRDWRLRVEDIIDASEAIAEYVQGLSLDGFTADRRTVDAVVRNLEVIGEAARHVPEEVRKRFPEIPWSDMADMRNVSSMSTSVSTFRFSGRRQPPTCPRFSRA